MARITSYNVCYTKLLRSHELKTPITAIRGAVETLLDEEGMDDAGQRFLGIIFKQSERLNALVEDLLDLSRIEQGVNEGGWRNNFV